MSASNLLTTAGLDLYSAANVQVFAHIVAALMLSLVVGYERTYHGRAAGIRTYGLVGMASCALVVLVAYPQPGFMAMAPGQPLVHLTPDPTRVIQGIVTGIGFLGAGMIMKDGLSISGLTSAASLWASSSIGILMGVGLHGAAVGVTLLALLLMMGAARLERMLPARPGIAMTLTFKPGVQPRRDAMGQVMRQRGYQVAGGSFHVRLQEGRHVWRFVAIEVDRGHALHMAELATEIAQLEGIEGFEIGPARN